MDGSHFDDLARSLASRRSRRGFLGGLAGLTAGLVAARRGDAACPPGQIPVAGGRCVCKATGRPPGPTGCPCPSGQTSVNGVCVNLSSDANNCGQPGLVCTPAPGSCQGASLCRGGVCVFTPAPAGTICREATGPCDMAAACDGVTLECPANPFVPGGTICREAQHQCDLPAACSGGSAECPPNPPQPNDTACSNGNRCDQTVCDNGVCTVKSNISCFTSDAWCIERAYCDPNTGCVEVPKEDGTPCPSGDQCRPRACLGGVCTEGVRKVCVPTNSCRTTHCNPATGQCDEEPKEDGTACGDGRTCCGGECKDTQNDNRNCGGCGNSCAGDLCQRNDVCLFGSCQGVLPFCPYDCQTLVTPCDPEVGYQCQNNCPPPNACQKEGTGVCQADGTCSYETTCDACHTCDPSTGTCVRKCRACEGCNLSEGRCVDNCRGVVIKCSTSFCRDDGTCSPPESYCGPCSKCNEATNECLPDKSKDGTSCGTCHICNANSECVPRPAGTSCGTCQVCTEQGHCGFADGASCGTCRVCNGDTCGFAAEGTPCGDDGHECDGAGNCRCALQCGNRCCPSRAVVCCPTLRGSVCCGVECTPTTAGVICQVDV